MQVKHLQFIDIPNLKYLGLKLSILELLSVGSGGYRLVVLASEAILPKLNHTTHVLLPVKTLHGDKVRCLQSLF
jgi:hypothetical protein